MCRRRSCAMGRAPLCEDGPGIETAYPLCTAPLWEVLILVGVPAQEDYEAIRRRKCRISGQSV